MSDGNVAVVRDQFAAVNERDWARAMDHYADDVVLTVGEETGLMHTGTYRGKEAVGEWFGDWFRTFDRDYHFEITEARELGDGLVYIHATHGGHGRLSGVQVHGENTYLYGVRDGKITSVGFYADREEALAAAEDSA